MDIFFNILSRLGFKREPLGIYNFNGKCVMRGFKKVQKVRRLIFTFHVTHFFWNTDQSFDRSPPYPMQKKTVLAKFVYKY